VHRFAQGAAVASDDIASDISAMRSVTPSPVQCTPTISPRALLAMTLMNPSVCPARERLAVAREREAPHREVQPRLARLDLGLADRRHLGMVQSKVMGPGMVTR
jgi:hypothetical protein